MEVYMYNENDNNYTTGGNYSSSYHNYQYNNSGSYSTDYYNDNSTNNYRKKAKKSSMGKKIVGALFLGAVFGLTSGVFFYGAAKYTTKELKTVNVVEVKPEADITKVPVVSESGIESTQTVTAVVTDVTNVVEEVMPSVVSITNTSVITQNFWGQQFQSENQSSGSGIIVGENENELLIVTNNHVIADSNDLKVQFIDGSVADAKIKGTDANMDLAVIAVKLENLETTTINSISIAALGDSDALKVGEPAIAIGNALGYGQSVTTGVISALNRQIEMSEDGTTSGTLIQTDAAINPGNSGGALLNVKGEVIGINSNKIGGSTLEGMCYAIPISNAKPIMEELMSRETKDKVEESKKGYLGISGLDVTSDVSMMYGMPEGVYIAQVYDGGAQRAGMLKGDIITAFDGSTVKTMEDLQGYLEYYEVGESVTVTVQRAGAGGYTELSLVVMLGKQSVTKDNR